MGLTFSDLYNIIRIYLYNGGAVENTDFDPVTFFKAMGCRARYEIFCLLLKNQLCVGAIAEKLGYSQPSVSQHLRVLKQAGIVEDRRCGYHVHYIINTEIIKQTSDYLSTLKPEYSGENPCSRGEGKCANANTLKN